MLELPVLRLGLSGFSADQRTVLAGLLQHVSTGRNLWQIGRFPDADAWWVNGERTRVLADGSVRVAAGTPTERALQLDLAQVDRPVAFALPLASMGFEPAYTFELASLDSVNAVLHAFETWLQPLAAQFALAARIVEEEAVLASGSYNVSMHSRPLAVVSRKGDIAIAPNATAADMDAAMWTRRAPDAGEPPEHFSRTTLSHIMWQYALRTARDLLPQRYRLAVLYFRRPPRVAHKLLRDSHLLLIRELACAAGTFEELQQRTGLGAQQMSRDLAALYLVGSITSNPKRASVTQRLDDIDSAGGAQASVHLSESVAPLQVASHPSFTDLTLPAAMVRASRPSPARRGP